MYVMSAGLIKKRNVVNNRGYVVMAVSEEQWMAGHSFSMQSCVGSLVSN